MFKKVSVKLVLALVLLATLISALILSAAVAVADDATMRTLSVTYNVEQCNAVYYKVEGLEEVQMESGKIYQIPLSSQVTIRVEEKTGYSLSGLIDGDTQENVMLNIATGNRQYIINAFTANKSYTVNCEPKVYQIVYVGGDGYTIKDAPGTHTFGTDTSINIPAKDGYDFVQWYLLTENDPAQEGTSIGIGGSVLVLAGNQLTPESGIIYLKPKWKPKSYDVWRYDYVFDPNGNLFNGAPLGNVSWKQEMGSFASGDTGENTVYTGYYYEAGNDKYFTTIASVSISDYDTAGHKVNTVFRRYLPITYTLVYKLEGGAFAEGATAPQTHVYNQNTIIPALNRTGYTFKGWTVTVDGNVVNTTPNPDLTLEKERPEYAASDKTITLTAVWEPNTYQIIYQMGSGAFATGVQAPAGYVYNAGADIPNPVRTGYSFEGWTVTYGGTSAETPVKDLNLPADTYTDAITLTANWKANTYTVTLNGTGATTMGTETFQVVFDTLPDLEGFIVPRKLQYAFIGYYTEETGGVKYINADGTPALTWKIGADTTLYARWELLPEISIEGYEFKINYLNETLGINREGNYRLSAGNTVMEISILNGVITVNGKTVSSIDLPDEFFGKTVNVTVCGDGVTTSDNSKTTLSPVARPAAPVMAPDKDIDTILADPNLPKIEILLNPGVTNVFEFAVSTDMYDTNLEWQTENVFEDLYQGTQYYVFVRVAATENAPHGEVFWYMRETGYLTYLQEKIDELLGLKQDGDGEMVDDLIQSSIDEAKALRPSATYQLDVEEIIRRVKNGLEFARRQDEKINDLRKTLSTLLASGCYSDENKIVLNDLCNNAVASIMASTTGDEVQKYYDDADKAMYRVLLSYLRDEDLELYSAVGLPYGSSFSVVKFVDFSTINMQIENAVRAGKLIMSGNLNAAQIKEALSTLEVMAAYNMRVAQGNVTQTEFEGTFRFRLLLPQELQSVSGLLVGYYNSKTGNLEVLETTRDGNYLIFTASHIADFVVFGDPTVNLTAMIAMLSVILLCQIIAVALLLVRRIKSGTAVKRYSFVLPALLAVQFAPAGALTVTLVLAALVVVMQVILLALLLTSDLVHKSDKKLKQPKEEPAIPAVAYPVVEPLPEEEPVLTTLTEEELHPDNILYEDSDGEEEHLPEESEALDSDDSAPAFADSEDMNSIWGEDFIEPAAATRYSLPEDEDAEEYTEEEDTYEEYSYREESDDSEDGEEALTDAAEEDDTFFAKEDSPAPAAYGSEEAAVWEYGDEEAVEEDTLYTEEEVESDAEEYLEEEAAEFLYDGEAAEEEPAYDGEVADGMYIPEAYVEEVYADMGVYTDMSGEADPDEYPEEYTEEYTEEYAEEYTDEQSEAYTEEYPEEYAEEYAEEYLEEAEAPSDADIDDGDPAKYE